MCTAGMSVLEGIGRVGDGNLGFLPIDEGKGTWQR